MQQARNIVLTGIPRAGTTLTCSLLNDAPNVVALFEPMQVELLQPGAAGAEQVAAFFAESRESLRQDRTAYSQHVDGRIPDNPFSSTTCEDGRRAHRAERGLVNIDKTLEDGFTLAIKHNGAFTALLPELSQRFECYGIVRNPVSVLGSWSSVELPVKHGRIPAAERLDDGLRGYLEAEPDLLRRQLVIIELFFGRFKAYLDRQAVVRYEDVVASDGQALGAVLDIGLPARALASRNSSRLYRGDQAMRWAEALLEDGGAWRHWYSDEDIRQAAQHLGAGGQ